jgi:hypothetical protein
MNKGTAILFLWLIIGAAAAGQRGYFSAPTLGCTQGATMAVTIAAGPLNYIGLNPKISCTTPKPSGSLGIRAFFIPNEPEVSPRPSPAGGSAGSCR